MKKVVFDLDGTLCEPWRNYGAKGEFMIFLLHKFPNSRLSRWLIRRFLMGLKPIMRPTLEKYSILTARMFWMSGVTMDWLRKYGYDPEYVTYVACNSSDRLLRATMKSKELRGQNTEVYYEDEAGTRRYLRALLPGAAILKPEAAVEIGHAEEVK